MDSQIFKIFLTTLLCLGNYKVKGQALTDYNLKNIATQISHSFPDTHTRSMNCFDIYMETIKDISENFETTTQLCITQAEKAYDEAEKASLVQQKDLIDRSTNSCNSLKTCEDNESAVKDFECYVSKGGSNAKDLYKLSSDSSTYLYDLKSEFRLIDRQQQSCISKAQREFNELTDEAMDDLNKCLRGSSPIPSPSPSAAVALGYNKVL
ncbi:uncharacterized protein ACRADG_007303 [Cochliomyia hominivorax]